MASASDDGNVILWVPDEAKIARGELGADADEGAKEVWRTKQMCRSSGAEVYDLAWSPDGVYFIIGSMDNVVRIYNAQTGEYITSNHFRVQEAYVHRFSYPPDCRTSTLCSGCCVGPLERIYRNTVIRSLCTHLHTENQGWPIRFGQSG